MYALCLYLLVASPHVLCLHLLVASPHLPVSAFRSGMRAAVAAGLPTFGILSGQIKEALEEAGACATVKDYTQLMAITGIAKAAAPSSG